jgi:hypothetical protein
MEPLEKTLFYKPTGTVQIANKFSLIERKLINAIVWHSQKRKFQPVEHAIPVRDVFHLLGLDSSRNNEVLKEALRTLTSTVIEWNRFGEDKVQEWGVCTFLASGVIRAGKLFYLLNPKLIEQINQPTLYAKIQLLVQSQVRKRHALVLYEFLLDALSRTRKDSLRVVVPLERLYELLGVNKATSYKFFNRDAIKPSVQEITKHTDLSVTYYTHREGRKVAELIFVVEKKAKFQRYLDLDTEHLDSIERLKEARAASGGSDLQSLLEDYGVGNRKAKELIATYEEDRIRGNIAHLVEQQKDKRRIRNPAAYLVKAIEEDYRPKPSAQEREADKAQAAQMRATQAQQAQEGLREEWKHFLQQRVKARFAEQSAEWQEEKRRRFVAQIEGEGKGNLLRSAYKKQGFNSAMVQAVFFSSLREELLTLPEETDFDKYLEYRVNSENT